MTQSTLQTFATKLVAKNRFVKVSFGGFAGSGKTRTMAEFAVGAYKDMGCKKPILLIDNEKGARFLVPFFKKHGIETYVKETTSLADVLQAMELLKAEEIDFLLCDSLSKVWYRYVVDYKEKNKITFMTLEHWGKILPAWQAEFSDRFVDLAGNFVFTGRGGFQYEREEDTTRENGTVKKGGFVRSGVKMKLAGETPFEPDLNIWMEIQQEIKKGKPVVWREGQVLKDRSGLIDGMTFKNPTYKNFQPVVKFLLDVPVGEVAGESDGRNLAPSEDFAYYRRKEEHEIQLEKIQAIFDKFALSNQSPKEKKIKVVILERVFKTSSAKEIEKMDAETLRFYRGKLEQLLTKWGSIEPEERLTYVESFDFTESTDDLPFGKKSETTT